MSTDFDPYYLWLGIPPQEQPPNHYRLLGIAVFESNPSVIDSAASRQSTYLHSVAAGPQRQASQKLLTEIAGARRTLLNAESKLSYDAELKTRIAAAAPKAVALPVARPVGVPVAVPIAAPVASSVTTPVASPVATPVAVPIAAPQIAAPVAIPIAAPSAAPSADPIEDPFSFAEAPVDSEPIADLFGALEDESTREVETPDSSAPTTSTTPVSSSTGSPPKPRSAKGLMWSVGGGVGVLALILAFVFRPRGDGKDGDETPTPPKKKVTAKKTESSTTAKAEPAPAQTNNHEAANIRRLVRFIRIELPRKGVLTVAEVEAFTNDGRNVAAYGFAEQSTTQPGAPPTLAIDGKTSGKLGDKSQSHTTDSDQPWWQLDLGGAYPLEKIVIHGGTDPGVGERLSGFTLLLFDGYRRPIVVMKDQPAPKPRSEFVVNSLTSTPESSSQPAPEKSKPAETKKPQPKPASKAKPKPKDK